MKTEKEASGSATQRTNEYCKDVLDFIVYLKNYYSININSFKRFVRLLFFFSVALTAQITRSIVHSDNSIVDGGIPHRKESYSGRTNRQFFEI